jgi:undecaprenyl-diphosphatase
MIRRMSIIEALLLGILQGIAEFLPISSSGHLLIAKHLFNLDDVPLLFDVVLHVATLLAVCIIFRTKIVRLFGVFIRLITRKKAEGEEHERRMIGVVIIATLATVAMSFFVKDIQLPMQGVFIGFFITSGFLVLSHYFTECMHRKLSLRWPFQGLFIGLFQGLAILPGISRSGSTITAGLMVGLSREEAGEYSFILSIPAIIGGLILTLTEAEALSSAVSPPALTIAFVAAFLSGLGALAFLMNLIKRGKLYFFAFYLIPVALFGLIFIK